MGKPITDEMLQGLSLVQLKTLQKNAQTLGTAAAHEVLDRIAQSGLLKASDPSPRKVAPKKVTKRKPREDTAVGSAPKPVRALHGRQA